MSYNQDVLINKRSDEQEYTLHLFEKCNLSCSFCWQDHKALEGVRTVRDKLKPIQEFLDKETKKKVTFNVMGGEVFDDAIFDSQLWADYYHLCHSVFHYAKTKGISARFNFVSNLVTNQITEVLELLEALENNGIQASLTTSYDAKGRFNQEQKQTWLKNVKTLIAIKKLSSVSMLFTKPVIRKLMNQGDSIFFWLYEQDVDIFIDYYTPTGGEASNAALLQANAPSDIDLLKAFTWIVDNYPKVAPMRDMIEKRSNALSCRSSKLVLSDGTKCMCGNLHLEDTATISFYKSPILPKSNDHIETQWLNERNCITCEHFSYCQMGCFMQHNFSKRTQMKECLYAKTYEYIADRKPIDFESLETFFGNQS